ncbi:hypothetical protein D3C71_1135460 [compost metagenome]
MLARARKQAFDQLHRAGLRGVGQDHSEFIAAETGGKVARAAGEVVDGVGDLAQNAVAHVVAVGVVVGLEVVHIDQQQAQRTATAACSIGFQLQRFFKAHAVGQAGEGVAVGLAPPITDAPQAPGQEQDDDAGHRRDRLEPQVEAAQQDETEQQRCRDCHHADQPGRQRAGGGQGAQHHQQRDEDDLRHRHQRQDGVVRQQHGGDIGLVFAAAHPALVRGRREQARRHAAGGHAHDHPPAMQHARGDAAFQHVAVGHLREGARWAGVTQADVVVAVPLVGRERGVLRAGQAGYRINVARQRHAQRRPIGRADAGLEVQATGDAVAFDFDIGVRELCGRCGNHRHRHQFFGDCLVAGRHGQHRQQHVAAALDRVGQQRVLFAVLAVGFDEQKIQRDTLGAGLLQAVEQARMGAARPGPLPELLQAVVINGDDQQAWISIVVPVADQLVVGTFVLLPEHLGMADPAGQRTHRCGQQQVLMPAQPQHSHRAISNNSAPAPAP